MGVDRPGGSPNDLTTLFSKGRVGDHADGALLDRFRATGDQAAFEVLVARHGPMVLRVCRARLADPAEVDDAFQAVFLTLVRRAGSIRSHDSLASWLHGVALRVASRSNVEAARRRRHETRAAGLAPTAEGPRPAGPDDAAEVLRQELVKLPDRYREAINLHYFEGRSCDEAAERLSRPVGTVKARLSRAREILRRALLRRGVSLPSVASLAESGAETQVPRGLLKATILSATRSGATPARVAFLAEGVARPMQLLGFKLAGACTLAAALAAGVVRVSVPGEAPAPVAPTAPLSDGEAVAPAPPAEAVETPESRALRLALNDAIPAGMDAADPYLATFALIRLAKAQEALGDHAAALSTLARADELAGTVPNEHLRRLAVMRTAVARGRIGDRARARASLDRFAREGESLGPEARYNLMSMVIDFYDQAGFKEEARAALDRELAAVDAVGDERAKDGGIHRLLYTQLTLGDHEGALRQAARYDGERSNIRASLLGAIMSYNRANERRPPADVARRALELAREITYPYPRALAECEIAAALARAGDIKGGLAVARAIGEGDPGSFEIRASEVPRALAEIAREQFKAGEQAAAAETLREAFSVAQEQSRKDGLHAPRVRAVSEAQAEVGDLEGATVSLHAIEGDVFERAQALIAIGLAEAKAGDLAAAKAALRDARAAAQEIQARPNVINDDPTGNADRVMRSLAVAQAEAGDGAGARETVEGRGTDPWKAETLASVAAAQAGRGDTEGALATARTITEPTRAAEAYGSVAAAQAKSGDAARALAWAGELEAPVARAFALVGIAEGLAARASETPGKP